MISFFNMEEWGNQNEKDSIYTVHESGNDHMSQSMYGKTRESNI